MRRWASYHENCHGNGHGSTSTLLRYSHVAALQKLAKVFGKRKRPRFGLNFSTRSEADRPSQKVGPKLAGSVKMSLSAGSRLHRTTPSTPPTPSHPPHAFYASDPTHQANPPPPSSSSRTRPKVRLKPRKHRRKIPRAGVRGSYLAAAWKLLGDVWETILISILAVGDVDSI